MHRRRIVERGSTREILVHPQHEYTKQLIDAAMDVRTYSGSWGLAGFRGYR